MRRWIQMLAQHTDVLAIGVITILAVMIVPLPTYVLDFLLTFNISLAAARADANDLYHCAS